MDRIIDRSDWKLAVLALVSATFSLWLWGYIDPTRDWWPFVAAGYLLMLLLRYVTNKISGVASRVA